MTIQDEARKKLDRARDVAEDSAGDIIGWARDNMTDAFIATGIVFFLGVAAGKLLF